MDALIIYDADLGDLGDLRLPTANGYVSRCVSAVAEANRPDARRLAAILNEFFQREPHGLDRIDVELEL